MAEKKQPGLLAKLSLFDATLLVMGSAIGSGIFLTSGIIARDLPDPTWILFVWLLGSVLTLFGGLTLAELGAMMPEAGGQYVYLREAYGPLAGFMYGWMTFLITHTGGIAALGVGFAEYVSYFFPQLSLQNYFLSVAGIQFSNGQLVALGSIGLLTVINYFGIRSGSLVQNFFTILKILAIGALLLGGLFVLTSGDGGGQAAAPMPTPRGMAFWAAVGVSLIAVLWTFDGWYSVNCVASEIRNVKKNLPLSLIMGISLIGIIYMLVNWFYVSALPMNEMAGVIRIGEKATTFIFGGTAGSIMSALILFSIFGCLSATVIYGPRIFYAMARDGLFFKSFAEVHPRHRTPSNAIIWQGVISGILCLTGTYDQLFTYVVFILLLFFAATAAAVFVLRIKRPDAERPYKVWGYPVIPALFGLTMLWIMVNTLIEKPTEALLGSLLLLTGFPVYYYWKKNRAVKP